MNVLRLTLDVIQMVGAVLAAVLLYRFGITTLSLVAATVTTAATALSIRLFGHSAAPPRARE